RCTIASRMRTTAASVMTGAAGPGGRTRTTPQMPHMVSGPFDPAALAVPSKRAALHRQHPVHVAVAADAGVKKFADELGAVGFEPPRPARRAEDEVLPASVLHGDLEPVAHPPALD